MKSKINFFTDAFICLCMMAAVSSCTKGDDAVSKLQPGVQSTVQVHKPIYNLKIKSFQTGLGVSDTNYSKPGKLFIIRVDSVKIPVPQK